MTPTVAADIRQWKDECVPDPPAPDLAALTAEIETMRGVRYHEEDDTVLDLVPRKNVLAIIEAAGGPRFKG